MTPPIPFSLPSATPLNGQSLVPTLLPSELTLVRIVVTRLPVEISPWRHMLPLLKLLSSLSPLSNAIIKIHRLAASPLGRELITVWLELAKHKTVLLPVLLLENITIVALFVTLEMLTLCPPVLLDKA